MSKFSGTSRTPMQANLASPVQTRDKRTTTHEGGDAFRYDTRSELFLLAATNMVKEDTFYEKASKRDERYVKLIHKVVHEDPTFIAGEDPEHGKIGLAEYLRKNLLMRSASTVMAAEYVAAGGPHGRSVVNRALQRPDEPAEILSYWISTHGRNLPMPLKRGVADAVRRLYNERAALRYDGQARGMRMGDVIELVHPKPKAPWQAKLFKYLLDQRHHNDGNTVGLDVLSNAYLLGETAEDTRRELLKRDPDILDRAGYSWERLSSWLPGGMDAEAWEAVIPTMGVMALIRNLRNFDQAGISEKAIDQVIAKITNEHEITKARLFPYQVFSAYREAPSDNWKRALGKTLDATVGNIPPLDGTLVLIDTSSSMSSMGVSHRSKVTPVEIAAVMGVATHRRSSDCDVVIFGNDAALAPFPKGESTLQGVQSIVDKIGWVGHGTYGHTALKRAYDPRKHKRVVIFTDGQMSDSNVDVSEVPTIYTFMLGGYGRANLEAGAKGRYTLGGFSDATFTIMEVLERGRNADWPF